LNFATTAILPASFDLIILSTLQKTLFMPLVSKVWGLSLGWEGAQLLGYEGTDFSGKVIN
jgi:hypothetical protein